MGKSEFLSPLPHNFLVHLQGLLMLPKGSVFKCEPASTRLHPNGREQSNSGVSPSLRRISQPVARVLNYEALSPTHGTIVDFQISNARVWTLTQTAWEFRIHSRQYFPFVMISLSHVLHSDHPKMEEIVFRNYCVCVQSHPFHSYCQVILSKKSAKELRSLRSRSWFTLKQVSNALVNHPISIFIEFLIKKYFKLLVRLIIIHHRFVELSELWSGDGLMKDEIQSSNINLWAIFDLILLHQFWGTITLDPPWWHCNVRILQCVFRHQVNISCFPWMEYFRNELWLFPEIWGKG